MVKAQAEVLGQVAAEIQVQVTGRDPEYPLDPIRPELEIPAYPSTLFVQARDLDSSQPLSPLVVAKGPGPIVSQQLSSPLSYCQHQPHQSAAKKCSCPFCASIPTKSRQRNRKAVVVNEDAAYGTDGNGDMGGKGLGRGTRAGRPNRVPDERREREKERGERGGNGEGG